MTTRWAGAMLRVALLTVGLSAVACGGSNGSHGSGDGAATSVGGTPAAPSITVLRQVDYQFQPTQFAVHSGQDITVENLAGRTAHTFTVQGQGIDVTNAAGASMKVSIDVQPGTYQFYCRFHGAPGRGMHGTLVVT
jgi:plastocyanin